MVAKNEIRILAIFLGLMILSGSCSYNDQSFFLIKAHVQTFGNDRWAIVSDENGKVLDYKQVVTNGVIEFKGFSTTPKVIYTTFDRTIWGYILTSTQAIPIGTELTLDTTTYPQSPTPEVRGKANFVLRDISFSPSLDPGYFQPAVEFGAGFWIYTLFGLTSTVYQGSTLSFSLSLQNVPSNVLGIGYRDGIPVYQWFNNINPGDTLASSFSSFLPSKVIPINKMTANFGVVGLYGDYINGGIGYSLSRYGHWYYSALSDHNKIPKLGYIDGFDNYWIYAYLHDPQCCGFSENTYFDSFGPVPALIDMPDYTYTLKSQSFRDFSFSFSNEYTYQTGFFTINGKRDSQTEIWWYVNAPAGAKLVQIQIPNDILSKYPGFKVDQLKLNRLNLVNELGGESYGDVFFKPVIFRKSFRKLTYQFLYD